MMACPATQLFEDGLLRLLADRCVLQLYFEEGGEALEHSDDCLIGDAAAVFEIDALEAGHILAHHVQ
jgi:hypothetical protein